MEAGMAYAIPTKDSKIVIPNNAVFVVEHVRRCDPKFEGRVFEHFPAVTVRYPAGVEILLMGVDYDGTRHWIDSAGWMFGESVIAREIRRKSLVQPPIRRRP